MAQTKVYSRSNVVGNPYLWRPTANVPKQETPIIDLGIERICDKVNDFITTYMTKRVWIATNNEWSSPPYVECYYVE